MTVIRTCPLCARTFSQEIKRGRPFTFCPFCRELTSDQRHAMEAALAKEKQAKS
jgi:hypothetical protein